MSVLLCFAFSVVFDNVVYLLIVVNAVYIYHASVFASVTSATHAIRKSIGVTIEIIKVVTVLMRVITMRVITDLMTMLMIFFMVLLLSCVPVLCPYTYDYSHSDNKVNTFLVFHRVQSCISLSTILYLIKYKKCIDK